MDEHRITLRWSRDGGAFERGNYRSSHDVAFQGGQRLGVSAAAGYGGDAALADPEQILAAAVASCHMLTFLAVAANRRLVPDTYEDDAVAVLGKNAEGKMFVERVTLRPRVHFSGDNVPSAEDVARLHERAHAACFIANSVKSEVVVEPRD
jgi:organic hydroperoxide reductase OsmC/OhrA